MDTFAYKLVPKIGANFRMGIRQATEIFFKHALSFDPPIIL